MQRGGGTVVERWEDGFAVPAQIETATAPLREDVAWSLAHKLAVLVAVVAVIIGLWGMTSQPRTQQPDDATLGPPIADSTQVRGIAP